MAGHERVSDLWDVPFLPTYGPTYLPGSDFDPEPFSPSHASFVTTLTGDSPTDISSSFSHSPDVTHAPGQRGRQQSISYSPGSRSTSGSMEYAPSYAPSIGYTGDPEHASTQRAVGFAHPQGHTLPSLHSPELALFSAFGQSMHALDEGPVLSNVHRRGDGVPHSSWRTPNTMSVGDRHFSSAPLPAKFELHHSVHPYDDSRRTIQQSARHHTLSYPPHSNGTRSNSLPTAWPCQWSMYDGQYTCGALLDDTSRAGITRHLREHHFSNGEWDKTSRGLCQWGNCARPLMDYASFGKHIASVHLREANAWSCEFCCRDFGRRDAMRRHMKTCPKAPEDAKPVSQAPRRIAVVR